MKVLLVTDGLFPFVMGGMQKHSYYLAKYLAGAGVKVHVVHPLPRGAVVRETDLPEFAWPGQGNCTFTGMPELVGGVWPGHYLRESRRYAEAVHARFKAQADEFDLVYCQGFTGLGFIRGRKNGTWRKPVVSNLHGYEMFQRMPSLRNRLSRGPLRQMAREVSLGSDFVFSFGGHISGILQKIGVPPQRILECPIGIEASWLEGVAPHVSRGARTFVFLGRNERRKGIKELHAALQGLARAGRSDWIFHMVGPIAKHDRLQAGNIVYHGALSDERQVREILRSADVLVCPSYSEGMPTVIMEAMASGLAVIATDVGAVSQQVDPNNGWLLEDPRPTRIGRALYEAMDKPAGELLRMKERSLAMARGQFTWESVINCKINALNHVLDKGVT